MFALITNYIIIWLIKSIFEQSFSNIDNVFFFQGQLNMWGIKMAWIDMFNKS